MGGNTAGIQAKHAGKLRLILGRLNVAIGPRDMALPGLRLHPLTSDRKGIWTLSGAATGVLRLDVPALM